MEQDKISLKDKIKFYKQKWLKEHVAVMVFVGLCILSVAIIGIIKKQIAMLLLFLVLLAIAHVWRYNAMMTYVENYAYDGKGNI